jgi:RNA polymerase sigma-70 factor (family 1)
MGDFNYDISFLKQLNDKKSEAFDQLYALYYRPLCYFAEGMVGNGETAQDLATESFIKLLQKPNHFDSTQSLKSYLYTITKNGCLDHLRKLRRHEDAHLEIMHRTEAGYDDAEHQLIRAEVLQTIYQAIEKLPLKYKQIMELALFFGKRNEEIAEHLQMAAQTVRNRKSEGLKILRMALHEHENLLIFFLGISLLH